MLDVSTRIELCIHSHLNHHTPNIIYHRQAGDHSAPARYRAARSAADGNGHHHAARPELRLGRLPQVARSAADVGPREHHRLLPGHHHQQQRWVFWLQRQERHLHDGQRAPRVLHLFPRGAAQAVQRRRQWRFEEVVKLVCRLWAIEVSKSVHVAGERGEIDGVSDPGLVAAVSEVCPYSHLVAQLFLSCRACWLRESRLVQLHERLRQSDRHVPSDNSPIRFLGTPARIERQSGRDRPRCCLHWQRRRFTTLEATKAAREEHNVLGVRLWQQWRQRPLSAGPMPGRSAHRATASVHSAISSAPPAPPSALRPPPLCLRLCPSGYLPGLGPAQPAKSSLPRRL